MVSGQASMILTFPSLMAEMDSEKLNDTFGLVCHTVLRGLVHGDSKNSAHFNGWLKWIVQCEVSHLEYFLLKVIVQWGSSNNALFDGLNG